MNSQGAPPRATETNQWLDVLDPARQRQLLLDVIALSSAADDLPALSDSAAALVARLSGADRCVIHVSDESRRRLVVAGGWPVGSTANDVVVPMGAGLAGWTASHGRPAISVDVNADRLWQEFPEGHPGQFASATSVPVGLPGSAPVGVISAFTEGRRNFAGSDVECLVGIGRLLAPLLAVARHHQHLHTRELSRHRSTEEFVALQEADRRRLAAEVHDGVGQRIAGLSFHLVAAAESLGDHPEFAAEQLSTARELADLAQAEVRSAVYGLRPPLLDDLGLADALASLGRRAPGLEVDVRAGEQPLPDHVATSLYRITQEALQNITKHAAATRASIELFPAGRHVVLRVADDGDGFDPGDRADGYGLRTMRERADLIGGHLDVVSRPGRGTTLSVRVPLASMHPATSQE